MKIGTRTITSIDFQIRNKVNAGCAACRVSVPAFEGWSTKDDNEKWFTICKPCAPEYGFSAQPFRSRRKRKGKSTLAAFANSGQKAGEKKPTSAEEAVRALQKVGIRTGTKEISNEWRGENLSEEDRRVQLQETVDVLEDAIQAQDEYFEKMMSETRLVYATVVRESPGLLDEAAPRVVVAAAGGQTYDVDVPSGETLFQGDVVRCTFDTMTILDVVEDVVVGKTATVTSILDEYRVEVDDESVAFSMGAELKVGQKVIVDPSASLIVDTPELGKDKYSAPLATTTWEDVGGLVDAKEALREAVELPFKHADLYAAYGKAPVKGVLMYGPPGCGKTLLAKATATSIATAHGRETTQTGFIYVKGPELLSKWVGQSEATVRSLFTKARDHKEEHGYPAVMFIDEAEAILGERGKYGTLSSTLVPQFLAEMDGFDDPAAVVLLATNRADTLDPAVTRDGRIDRKVFVGRPDIDTAEAILRIHFAKKRLAGDVEEFVEFTAAEVFSDAHVLREKAGLHFCLRHILNGAMLAGITDVAANIAIGRDIAKGSSEPTGINTMDVAEAVIRVVDQNRRLNHNEALEDFLREAE